MPSFEPAVKVIDARGLTGGGEADPIEPRRQEGAPDGLARRLVPVSA